MPVPGSCPLGSHTGLRGLEGDLLGLRPRLILSVQRKQSLKASSSLLKREKGFLSKGSRAETAPLPCENHARKMRTFFSRLEPKTRSSYHIKWSTLSETLSSKASKHIQVSSDPTQPKLLDSDSSAEQN